MAGNQLSKPKAQVTGYTCKRVCKEVLVVVTDKVVTPTEVGTITSVLKNCLPGCRCIVVPPGWDIHAVKDSDLRALRDSIDRVLHQFKLKNCSVIPKHYEQ